MKSENLGLLEFSLSVNYLNFYMQNLNQVAATNPED